MIGPDPKIFCNSPWYELNIYWDGSFGTCCAEDQKLYTDHATHPYRVQNMSIREWYRSQPMRQARLDMLGHRPNAFCSQCYNEETHRGESKRYRNNQKSVIFMHQAFADSFRQSPGHALFLNSWQNRGDHDAMPIDIHIDLGNYCNLACKMCSPQASNKIAAQHARWNIQGAEQFINTDWTRDDSVWHRVMTELADIANLRNVHFMGGETLITKRFEDFVDFMIARDRLDLCISYVTNGTVYNESLLAKLAKFAGVTVEVSIESLDATNSYQRQGTDQDSVMRNLERYMKFCDCDHRFLSLRPAISALTIGSYGSLLRYAHQHNLIVKSLLVTEPRYLDARILPGQVKHVYLDRYDKLMHELELTGIDTACDFNDSDPHQASRVIANQIKQCRSVLTAPEPHNADQLRSDMVSWCRRWDDIYGYDAREIYPELRDVLDRYGY